jgi:hypothetical protein
MDKDPKKGEGISFNDYLAFQIRRNVVNLYKYQLAVIEDLRQDHLSMLQKLKKKFPEEKINDVDYFNSEKYNYIRKKTLDVGNEAIRDFESSIEKLEISLKKKK